MLKKVVLTFLFLFVFALPSYGVENATPSASVYQLPHPGMLPDHPLYKVKVLRDKLILILTRDTEKKAQYHLLLADKRINMAKFLVDKGNVELAKKTALKGENEITLITFLFKDERKKPSEKLMKQLEAASLRHQEVLLELEKKVGEKDKETFRIVRGFSKTNIEELQKIYKNY